MAIALKVDLDLPAYVKTGLENFCHQLQESLGDQLIAVILYGSLAKGETLQPNCNVNVMLMLERVTIDLLDKIRAPVQQGLRDFRLAVMILSESDLHSSTDVFPIKFLDMQRHHCLLLGRDPFTNLTIARDHLRLRCEQEIKNLLLRLRQYYLLRSHRSDLIESLLANTISAFITSLSALLILRTGAAPVKERDIAIAAAREIDADGALLVKLLDLRAGDFRPEAGELKDLYNGYMTIAQKAAEIADKL